MKTHHAICFFLSAAVTFAANRPLAAAEANTGLDLATFRHKAADAYEKAKQEGKALLVFFDIGYNGFTKRTLARLAHPSLAKYADKFVVAVTHPDHDKACEMLEKKFKVDKFPTILVLRMVKDPSTGKLTSIDVTGRMIGEQGIYKLDKFLRSSLDNFTNRPALAFERAKREGACLLLVFSERSDPVALAAAEPRGLARVYMEHRQGQHRKSLVVAVVNPKRDDAACRAYAQMFGIKYRAAGQPLTHTYVLVKFGPDGHAVVRRMVDDDSDTETAPNLSDEELRQLGIVD